MTMLMVPGGCQEGMASESHQVQIQGSGADAGASKRFQAWPRAGKAAGKVDRVGLGLDFGGEAGGGWWAEHIEGGKERTEVDSRALGLCGNHQEHEGSFTEVHTVWGKVWRRGMEFFWDS